MPSWGEILTILNQVTVEGPDGQQVSDFDGVRRGYLTKLHQHTGRNVILYASAFTQPGAAGNNPAILSINDEDIQGLMEVMRGLEGDGLDLVLHSPGGSIAAAEAFVKYIRSKFDDVRVFVPQQAMSAATMIACSADEVVLGKHSFLGAIDPQFEVRTKLGGRMVAAEALLDQFERAKKECADPKNAAAWEPMLEQYGPELLVRCENAIALSRSVSRDWLYSYNLRGVQDEEERGKIADELSGWLASHSHLKIHERHISRDELTQKGMNISELEGDDELQDLVLSVFHATTHTFAATRAVKIIENQCGAAFLKMSG